MRNPPSTTEHGTDKEINPLTLVLRWHGCIGGAVGGCVTAAIYFFTRDRVTIPVVFSSVLLFAISGFMLGLFFENFGEIRPKGLWTVVFVAACGLSGAVSVAPMGSLSAKLLTEDCFRLVEQGLPASQVCHDFVGNLVLIAGSIFLALSVSLGCYRRQMIKHRAKWFKPALAASFISLWIAGGEVALLDVFDIGGKYFDIAKPRTQVNRRSVLIGGAILGGTMGLLVGAHAALMLAFAPKEFLYPIRLTDDGFGAASSKVILQSWQQKLEFLLAQEPITEGAEQKFVLMKKIEEARAKIQELGVRR